MVATMAEASATIQELNKEYEARHRAFEDNFWATKMGLKVTAALIAKLAPCSDAALCQNGTSHGRLSSA